MITDYIDKAIKKGHNPRKRSAFYFSDAGSCPRKIWFEWFPERFESDIPSSRLLRIFDNGNKVHERITAYLEQAGILKESEVSIRDNLLNLHGRCDNIVTINGEDQVIEVKSINLRTVKEPLPAHIDQLMLYLHYFGKDIGWLIYESKQTQELFEFKIEYDRERVKKLLSWFSKLKENVENLSTPKMPEDYSQGKYPCMYGTEYCPYWKYCWGDKKL